MLLLTVAGRVSGCVTRKDIVEYGNSHLEELRDTYGILDNGCPSEPTLHRMEKHIDCEEFERQYSEFATSLANDCVPDCGENCRVVAMDGKYMRGTLLANGRSPDIVSLYDADSGIALGTEMCEEKSNEIKAVPKLLERVSLPENAVVTGDAMNCQTGIVELIRQGGSDYFIALKANQKAARWSVEDELPGMTADDEYHSEPESDHGRIHERVCRVFKNLGRIKGLGKFPDVKAVVEISTHTTAKSTGKEQSETRYYITSIDGCAKLYDSISRKHWGIENNLHWELDTLQKQDATKRKDKTTARNLDTIQKTVHAVFAYSAGWKLPEAIARNKEKSKTKFMSLRRMAMHSISFTFAMMAL